MVWRGQRSVVGVMTVDTLGPSIFDVAWPTFAYHDVVLSYDLVRTVLRDSRFAMPRGISLVVQGISSGPIWDKVCQTLMCVDAAEHHRLRRLVSRAFTPRTADRMRTACVDVISKLVDRHSRGGPLRDGARHRQAYLISELIRARRRRRPDRPRRAGQSRRDPAQRGHRHHT